jgi:hypothetical protein
MRHAAIALLVVAACGGQVRTSDEGDPAPSGAGGQSDQVGSGTALPPCRLGFRPEEENARSCDFLADGRCYGSKVDACACVCPNRPGTNCMSGFPEPDGRVVVTCQ